MVIDDVGEAVPRVEDQRDEAGPRLFLGSYPPFLGIRYFVLLDEEEVARGANKVGPVGWTRTPSGEVRADVRISRN